MPSEHPWSADGIRGVIHEPDGSPTLVVVLSHGAGSNCHAPILVAVADELARRGALVARIDLAFRQQREKGPPNRARAAEDREGLARAAQAARQWAPSTPLILGGHSYGGRQASMLLAERPELADGLLALSYPLHPPTKPEILRTEHFPSLTVRSLFVHGVRDPFATSEELRRYTASIPADTTIVSIEKAAHDLAPTRASTATTVADAVTENFEK